MMLFPTEIGIGFELGHSIRFMYSLGVLILGVERAEPMSAYSER